MKFGLFHEFPCHEGVTQREVFSESFELVDEAERMGVDGVWLAEYHFLPQRSVLSSPVTVATAIAARTQRMRIGLAVQVLPLGNPVRMAEEIATLDHISQGRLDFGIGRSTFAFIYEGFGMNFGESRDRFTECLDIILKGWTEDQFSYEGEYYRFENSMVVPKPYQDPHPPISVGVTSAETFPMVGRMGYPILINPSRVFSLSELAEYIQDYQQARKDAGHPRQGRRRPPGADIPGRDRRGRLRRTPAQHRGGDGPLGRHNRQHGPRRRRHRRPAGPSGAHPGHGLRRLA